MVEYLYGFGGCVCEDGDNSGDEEEDDAMAKETEKAEEKECCVSVRRRCGLQSRLGITWPQSQQTLVNYTRLFPIILSHVQLIYLTVTGIPFVSRTPAPPPASTHLVQTNSRSWYARGTG